MRTEGGYTPDLWRPGDIGFGHNPGIVARGIRYAERRDGEDDTWNHQFALDRQDPTTGEWYIIEAQPRGITNNRTLADVAPGGSYQIVPFPDDADRAKFLEFVRAQLTDDYSVLSILSDAVDMYLPDSICLRRAWTWICSGLITAGLMYAGYPPTIKLPDLYTTTPGAGRSMLPAEPHYICYTE